MPRGVKRRPHWGIGEMADKKRESQAGNFGRQNRELLALARTKEGKGVSVPIGKTGRGGQPESCSQAGCLHRRVPCEDGVASMLSSF